MSLSSSIRRRLASMAVLAPLYYTSVTARAMRKAPPGYSSTQHTMSRLAARGTSSARLMNAAFAGYGVLVQGLGPLLHHEARGGKRGRALWGLVAIYGLGAVLAAKYPTRSERQVLPGITENSAHNIAGGMTLSSIGLLMALSPRALKERPAWCGWWRWFSYTMFAATCILTLPYYSRTWLRKRGLFQRSIFVTTMTWVMTTALRLRKVS